MPNAFRLAAAPLVCLGMLCSTASLSAADDAIAEGRELFKREWIPKDPRSPDGDGLGPVFNDTSCVACHNQGGVGGAGSAAKNAQILSVFKSIDRENTPEMVKGVVGAIFGGAKPKAVKPVKKGTLKEQIEREREQVAKIHPGFGTARSLVLHRSSTDDAYAPFRAKLTGLQNFAEMGDLFIPNEANEILPVLSDEQKKLLNNLRGEGQFAQMLRFGGGAQIDGFAFLMSERNTPALFGTGAIDSIPDEAILAGAKKKYREWPDVSGRAAKLKDGRIGRFGWKGQKAKLSDFVLTACAVELGLNVPGQPQSGSPHNPDYKAPGLDLTEDQCNALIAYVASLPSPQEVDGEARKEARYLAFGRKHFEMVGCAACHRPELGEVKGVYSDLLLHDMGPAMGDSGNYGTFVPNSTEDEDFQEPLPALTNFAGPFGGQQPFGAHKTEKIDEKNLIGATRLEWRTPPLWGLRDSAPYLHDGRANTIEQAIALHGGEASRSTFEYLRLTPEERNQLSAFLRSLAAPE